MPTLGKVIAQIEMAHFYGLQWIYFVSTQREAQLKCRETEW